MIAATRRPSTVARPSRLLPERELQRLPKATSDHAGADDVPSDQRAHALATIEAPVAAALDVEHTGGAIGLLAAFVLTTLVLVVGVSALAVLSSWWALVPVVLVHWIATSVILARIDGMLSQ